MRTRIALASSAVVIPKEQRRDESHAPKSKTLIGNSGEKGRARLLLVSLCCAILTVVATATLASAQEQLSPPEPRLTRYVPDTPTRQEREEWLQRSIAAQTQSLGAGARIEDAAVDPLQFDHWVYGVTAGRDNGFYQGVPGYLARRCKSFQSS